MYDLPAALNAFLKNSLLPLIPVATTISVSLPTALATASTSTFPIPLFLSLLRTNTSMSFLHTIAAPTGVFVSVESAITTTDFSLNY